MVSPKTAVIAAIVLVELDGVGVGSFANESFALCGALFHCFRDSMKLTQAARTALGQFSHVEDMGEALRKLCLLGVLVRRIQRSCDF